MTGARTRIRCAPGTAERVTQGAIGVLLAAFALDSLANPLLAALTAAGAVLLVVGAIRGWCPGGLLAARAAAADADATDRREREPLER
ncbi:hypothetical protein [Agrococcus sp. HG114]|uniref:hypothetical protein n=1 Tax=Agrococcus sp. HG114 TaxID=2969757 RepID=UPI00215AFA63|nr:hypothetical protein [Agrococcus sp. HG114]MCR8670003.1 hypothetical protein [Agrococcus sp. HG114]